MGDKFKDSESVDDLTRTKQPEKDKKILPYTLKIVQSQEDADP